MKLGFRDILVNGIMGIEFKCLFYCVVVFSIYLKLYEFFYIFRVSIIILFMFLNK